MVTAPVLRVEPAAMVRVLLDVMVKSSPAACDVGDAETTRVTSCEEGPLREAATLATPPFSPMEGRAQDERYGGRGFVVGDGQRSA